MFDLLRVLIQVHMPVENESQSTTPEQSVNPDLSIIKDDNKRAVGLASPLPNNYRV